MQDASDLGTTISTFTAQRSPLGLVFDMEGVAVYNLTGQKVATLVDGSRQAGTYTIRWDGRDETGHSLGNGVYLYRLQTGARAQTRKLLLFEWRLPVSEFAGDGG